MNLRRYRLPTALALPDKLPVALRHVMGVAPDRAVARCGGAAPGFSHASETRYVSDWGNLFYRVDANDCITGVGGDWNRLALENDATSIVEHRVVGTRLLSHVHDDATRLFVWTMLDAVRKLEKPVTRPYRCDSPGFKRHMEMRIEPDENDGLIVAHRVVRVETLPAQIRYTAVASSIGGMLGRCSMCNRLRIAGTWREPDHPDCAALIAKTIAPAVFYGVCPDCRDAVRRPTSTL